LFHLDAAAFTLASQRVEFGWLAEAKLEARLDLADV
jgi:hypothetical protein